MDFEAAGSISQFIQLAVAPVFLLAGIGAFVNAFASRLARTFDRSRHLEARLEHCNEDKREQIIEDLAYLRHRAQLAYMGLALGTLSALLVCVLIAVTFAGYLFDFTSREAIAVLFLAAMLSLIGGLVIFLYEIQIAVRRLRIGQKS